MRATSVALALAAALGHAAVQAQTVTPPISIVPYVSLSGILTDNAGLTTSNEESDFIALGTAGFRLNANSGRVRGYVDYSLLGLTYARDTASSDLQNALSAFLATELIENRAFIDVTGSVSQQSISAFGTQPPDPFTPNANRTEVRTFSASPYLRGPIGLAEYEARLRYTDSRSKDVPASDQRLSSGLLHVGTGAMFPRTEASLDFERDISDYASYRKTTQDVLRGVVAWKATTDVTLSLIGGRESNNLATLDKQSYDLWGGGVHWTPSERAELSVRVEDRFFGTGHAASVKYRTPRTATTFTDSRDVSTSQASTAPGRGTSYDLYFLQFATVQPDPVLRQQLVNDFLKQHGISPTAPVEVGFLSSAVTLESRQDLSFGWLGVRSTATLTLTRTESSRLDTLTVADDDLATASEILQYGASLILSHRLTPLSSLRILFTYQESVGSPNDQKTKLGSANAMWLTRVGPRTDFGLGVRHARFRSPTSPYDESAVFGSFTVQF